MSRGTKGGTERVRNSAQDQDQDQVLNTHLVWAPLAFEFEVLFKEVMKRVSNQSSP